MEARQGKGKGIVAVYALMVLLLITAGVYWMVYSKTRFMSWDGFRILLGGVVLALVLLVAKLERFAPAVLFITSLLGLLFHVYSIYFFISSVVTGIQFSGFPTEFYVVFVLFGVDLILSIVCVFLPIDECKEVEAA